MNLIDLNLPAARRCFIVYAVSCSTSDFDVDRSFGEALMTVPRVSADGGAIGYVGYSNLGWIPTGDDFERAFFRRLATTRHLGLLNDSRTSVFGTTDGRFSP